MPPDQHLDATDPISHTFPLASSVARVSPPTQPSTPRPRRGEPRSRARAPPPRACSRASVRVPRATASPHHHHRALLHHRHPCPTRATRARAIANGRSTYLACARQHQQQHHSSFIIRHPRNDDSRASERYAVAMPWRDVARRRCERSTASDTYITLASSASGAACVDGCACEVVNGARVAIVTDGRRRTTRRVTTRRRRDETTRAFHGRTLCDRRSLRRRVQRTEST